MQYCSQCGTQNRDGSKFCNNCGANLSTPSGLVCPMCSTANPVENVFCQKCGARLAPLTAAPAEDSAKQPPPIKGLSLPAKSDSETIQPESEPTEKTEIPTWLAGLRDAAETEDEPESDTPSVAEPGSNQGEPEWLARLRATPAEPESAPLPESPSIETPSAVETEQPTPQLESDVPAWLKGSEEQPSNVSEPTASTQEPGWLTQLRDNTPAESPAPTSEESEPAWVKQMSESAPQAQEAPSVPDASVPAWLQAMQPAEPKPIEAPAEPSAIEPDWLKQTSATPFLGETEVNAPDWLKTVTVTPNVPSIEPVVPATPVAETPAPPGQSEDEMDEWLLENIKAGAPLAMPELNAPTAPLEEDEVPDWLRTAKPSEKPEPILAQVTAPSLEPATHVPEWVAALKPAELSEEWSSGEAEPLEVGGPLAGLRGILPLANAVIEPHTLGQAKSAPTPTRRDGVRILESILASPLAVTPSPIVKPAPRFSIVRLLIYLLLIAVVCVPLILPPDVTSATLAITRTPAREFFEVLDQAAKPNTTVVLAFDYDPGLSGEMDLQARAVTRYLAGKNIPIATISTLETGPQVAQRVLDLVVKPGYEYGTQVINLGYFAGNESALANLATAKFSVNDKDWRDKKSIRPFLETSKVTGLGDAALVIAFAGDENALKMWVEQAQPRGVKLAAGVSSSVEVRARTYRDAKQLLAMMYGVVGAAQFEILSGKPGAAVVSANAQNAAMLAFVLFIILGNIAFLFSRARSKSK